MKYQNFARIKGHASMKKKFDRRVAIRVSTQIKEESSCA